MAPLVRGKSALGRFRRLLLLDSTKLLVVTGALGNDEAWGARATPAVSVKIPA